MVDRENVIKGLTAHMNGNCNERDCPWYYDDKDGCLVNLLDATLELLKEQEPRVMDADEIVLSADPSKWLWVERKGDYCAEAFKAGKTISGWIAFDSETPGSFLYCERPDEYGKTWRCWTSRPTDEQRMAVKWDAAD